MFPHNLTAEISSSRLSVQLLTGLLLVNLSMIFMAGVILEHSRRQYQSNAEITTLNLAHVLEENFAGSLEQIDVSILTVIDEINRQTARGKIDSGLLNALLTMNQERLLQIDKLLMTDKQGRVRYGKDLPGGSLLDVGNSLFFTYLRDHNNPRLYISEPINSEINHKWSLPVARRFNNPDGTFAGIVFVLVSLDSIRETFSHLNIGAHGIVNLRDGAMNIIVRFPESESTAMTLGKNTLSPELKALLQTGSPIGTYHTIGVLDKFERTFSFRKLPNEPLYVSVGFADQDYLSEWRGFEIKLVSLVSLFILLTSAAAWFIYRGEKRRRITAKTLQALNLDFLRLLENTTDFIYFKDKDSRIRFCSQAMADITGHKNWREMVGKHDVEIFPAETARIYTEEELPVFRDGTAILNRINPYYDKDGKQRWVSTNKWPVFAEDGKTVIGIYGISRDISDFVMADKAMRESEQRFRIMFHKHSSSMLLIDPGNGTIVDANEAAARYYGYSESQLRGMTISNINTLSEEEIRLERQQALAEKRNHFIFPHRLASGEIRTVEVYSTPIEDNGKQLLFSIVYDITERKKTEEALTRSNTDLERFAYSVSHDMRQPLRAVSGHLQLLQRSLKDTLDENDCENLGFALEGARRMDSMIVSLLDYSRVGRKTESKQWIQSRASLDEALRFLEPMISETGALVKLTGEWPQVYASRDELIRLLQNLIANAIKFRTANQSAVVEITSSVQDKIWRVSVQDQGVGINPQHIHRLFQFFSRLHSRERFEGTGMGLALCRRIVEHHQGRIWAESDGENKGSRFIFELGLSTQDEESPDSDISATNIESTDKKK
jgi:PAS domain S-box-containing protein